MNTINDFIYDVCDTLNIDIPIISFDISNFQTHTMMAQCDSAGTTIYLKKPSQVNFDFFFAIAHELRHIWQIRNNQPLYFSNYKPREICTSLEEYNLQLAEIDANAFAGLIMIDFFNIKPLFNNMSSYVRDKIYQHIETLTL